jgi:hypothetical protein
MQPTPIIDKVKANVAEVVDLDRFRRKLAADKGFRTWLQRFQDQFGPDTRLEDLAPETLLYLATPGEENLYVFFDLIMGAKGLGGALRFRLDDLETPTKLRIMDAACARGKCTPHCLGSGGLAPGVSLFPGNAPPGPQPFKLRVLPEDGSH